jgi:hypothetical protein
MGVENNSYSITNLATSDTFYDWYSKTNTDIIGKLNFLKMYSGLSGDGVDVSINPAGGVHTFSITPSITKGISFNGPISFNDAVSFNGSTDFTTITVKVPLASGLTSGDVVRIDSSSGLTFAIANSTQNAEMFGVVSHHSGSETVVKVAGTIDNTLFTNTIENMLKISGGTFAPGTVYFLDSTKYGGVTVNDATEYGTVSKPVILGITGNKGCILPYRGIANTGFTGAGVTADLDNNTYSMVLYTTNHLNGTDPVTSISNIDVGSYVFLPKNFSSWCLGSPVTLGETACITSVSFTDGSSTPNLIIINDTTCLTTQPNAAIVTGNDYVFFGIVSKIYSKNTTTGEITLQITTDGGGFILSSTELSSLSGCVNKPSDTVGGINLYRSTVQFINTSLGDPGRFQSRKTTINTASGSPSVPEGYGVIGIPISGNSVLFRVVRTAYGISWWRRRV